MWDLTMGRTGCRRNVRPRGGRYYRRRWSAHLDGVAVGGTPDEVVSEDEVLPRAIAIAAQWAPKADPSMAVLKRGMYPRALEALATKLEL